MQDGKTKTVIDRRFAAGSQKYEVGYFAKKHGIKESDARRIIKQHGRDRDAADRAASRLRGGLAMALGIAAGVGVGAVIGGALESMPIGIAIGIADGAAFHRREVPLAEEAILAVSLQVARAREPLRR